MYKPDGHTNSALGDSLLKSFNNYRNISGRSWPTKDTVVYVTFKGQKLEGQFSENLVLWISEFLFNLVVKFPKKKEL